MPAYVSEAEPDEDKAGVNPSAASPASCNVCNCGPYGDTPDFPSAKNRAARLAALARQGHALQESDRALAAKASVAHGGKLTASDFAVALGKPRPDSEHIDKDVADAFARAWAEDGEVLRYNNADYQEATAPPGMDSRAAAGWKPMAQGSAVAVAEPENQLFEAYGASYAEAYAVALALEFSEEKPVPDDKTGDVTGLVSSILHPPSGEPILLGTVLVEDKQQAEEEFALSATDTVEEKPLPMGRLVLRYLLLALGAGALAVAGLYFTGYLL